MEDYFLQSFGSFFLTHLVNELRQLEVILLQHQHFEDSIRLKYGAALAYDWMKTFSNIQEKLWDFLEPWKF